MNAAWASYGNMRLDGVGFGLAILALDAWALLLVLVVALGGTRRTPLAVIATVVTALLAAAVAATVGDGRMVLGQRPLGGWAVFALLSTAAIPALLAAPWLQWADRWRRAPALLAGAAVALVPAGTFLFLMLQQSEEERVFAQGRALAPGTVQAHVTAARQAAARSWRSPYLWNEDAEAKWLAIGLGQNALVDGPQPLSASDAAGLALVIAAARKSHVTGKLEGKLLWDRLMGAPASERPRIAAAFKRDDARRFAQAFGVPHADWLCAPLAEPDSAKAVALVHARLDENDRKEFSDAVRAKCGKAI
jgi:hypothetical protein